MHAHNAREATRQLNRDQFPGTTALVDDLRAGGFSCRVLYTEENGRTLGQREPFDGIDVDRLLALEERQRHC
jgi:hypothetical protein